MTREECLAVLARWDTDQTVGTYGVVNALRASLEREAKLLSNGARLFDMALVRNRALEEAALAAEQCNGTAEWAAQDIRNLKTPPDPERT